jgi:hypothetical protein
VLEADPGTTATWSSELLIFVRADPDRNSTAGVDRDHGLCPVGVWLRDRDIGSHQRGQR